MINIRSAKIVLVAGKFIFTKPEISELLDLKIYLDSHDDVRLARRI